MTTSKLDLFGEGRMRPVHIEAHIDFFIVYRETPDNVVWITDNLDDARRISDEAEGYTYVVQATKSILVKALNNIDETDDEVVYQAMKTITPKLYSLEYLQPFYNKYYKKIISQGLENKSKVQLEKIVKLLDGEGIGLAITIRDINFPDEDVHAVAKEMLANM